MKKTNVESIVATEASDAILDAGTVADLNVGVPTEAVEAEKEPTIVCPLCEKKFFNLTRRAKIFCCPDCAKAIVSPITYSGAKTGRNKPCPCGKKNAEGKPMKYKKCCGKSV